MEDILKVIKRQAFQILNISDACSERGNISFWMHLMIDFLPIRIFGIKPFLVCLLEVDNINVCLVNSLHISLAWIYTHGCGSINPCHCNPKNKRQVVVHSEYRCFNVLIEHNQFCTSSRILCNISLLIACFSKDGCDT